ncbi:hypothetical protein CTAYLR_007937 [Chrysophaeum taylorii]|uniref:Uncharacterized protein n=1 Tax=Chrysophaeum taylorii TaxID=2483200 RepID=A0AAD7UPD3_9STRA|nr:hypothetical protein CTAYLR_007937 [Chrysophaeum taylorii]
MMLPRRAEGPFPRVIWTAWFSVAGRGRPREVDACFESWRRHNPNYEFWMLDDANIESVLPWGRMWKNATAKVGIAGRTDFLRAYLVATRGGVWVDSLAFCREPLDPWLPKIVGAHGFYAPRQAAKDRQLMSWFFAGKPATPIAKGLLELAADYLFRPRTVVLETKLPIAAVPANLVGTNRTGEAALEWLEATHEAWPYFWFHYLFNQVLQENGTLAAHWTAANHISVVPRKVSKFNIHIGLEEEEENNNKARASGAVGG